MAEFQSIANAQVDANSPLNEELMQGDTNDEKGGIKYNFDALNDTLTGLGGGPVSFKVNGPIDTLDLISDSDNGKALDCAEVLAARQIQAASIFIGKGGSFGTLTCNVRKLNYINKPITSIQDLFTANTQSIARAAAQLNTQSITKAETDIDTQSITYEKVEVNVQSIIQVTGLDMWRYNLDSLPDEDYIVGASVFIDGCANANNDGTFEIMQRNKDGGSNIVIQNSNGLAQNSPQGTLQLLLVKYQYLANIPTHFEEGEEAVFAGHDDVSNNGTFEIYKKNVDGGDILIFKTAELVEQAAPNGSASCLRFSYNFLAATPVNYVIGEKALFASHTNAANDGSFEIKDIDYDSGFNIILYNTAGAEQAGVTGTIDTYRFVYALDENPVGLFEVDDNAILTGHDDSNNDGTFPVKVVSYLATNNIVIYNELGVIQAGVNGSVAHADKVIELAEDLSSIVVAGKSSINITGTYADLNNGEFLVKDINRAAISPYNLICELTSGILQPSPDGQINSEVRSIFTDGFASFEILRDNQSRTFTLANNELTNDSVLDGSIMFFDILEAPIGANNISINIK